MRLIQLVTGTDEVLDLHPNVTVVQGLDEAGHVRLVETVEALVGRAEGAAEGIVEAHGILFDIDADLIGLLEARVADIDPVVRSDDLPTGPRSGEREALSALEAAFAELLERVAEQAEEELQARGRVATTTAAVRAARSNHERAEKEAAPPDPGPVERDKVDAALGAEAPADLVAAVAAALQALESGDRSSWVTSFEAATVADQLDAAAAELGEAAPSETDQLNRLAPGASAAARTRLDDARQALLEAEVAVRTQPQDPSDVAELERAHERLLDAIDKADGRWAGDRAQRRVDAARQVEQQALDRLGFGTYTDYVMGYSATQADPAVLADLEGARTELAEAEEAWFEVERDTEAALVRAAALDRRRALLHQARTLLGERAGDRADGLPDALPEGHAVDPVSEAAEVSRALRELRVPPEGAVPPDQQLVAALDAAGMDLEGEDLDEEDLTSIAEAWLAETERADERRTSALADLASLEGAEPAELTAAADALAAAERDHQAAVAALDAVAAALAELEDEGHHLAEEVERGREAVAAQGPSPPNGADELEWYLMARLAAQRSVSVAGSAPLLLDDALRGLAGDDLHRLLDRLEPMADAVQVIVVSEDPVAATWAEAAGPPRAAVVRPGAVDPSERRADA